MKEYPVKLPQGVIVGLEAEAPLQRLRLEAGGPTLQVEGNLRP